MKLIYYKSDIGNFGDDVNAWLWEKLLGEFSQYPDDLDFVGIGSILDARLEENPERKKIIFGSGVRDIDFSFSDKANIDTRFVRGPISGRVLDAKYITDAAYCLRLLPKVEYAKKYKISFIPYFRHVPGFNWGLFEKLSGIHVIYPTNDVEQVIREINESELILTSAMHGAIFADIYRVPWMRVKFGKHGYETHFTSELKWQDWLRTIGLQNIPVHFFDFAFDSGGRIKSLYKMMRMIKKFKANDFCLSDEKILAEIERKLNDEVSEFIKKYRCSGS